MAKTQRGRVYLLETEKRVLLEMFRKLDEAGRPGAWSKWNIPRRGRPPSGVVNLPVSVSEQMADRIRANAELRRIPLNVYLGQIVTKAFAAKE
jgi:hypothetical protein